MVNMSMQSERGLALRVSVGGLFLVLAVGLAMTGGRYASAQDSPDKQEAKAAAAKWTLLFRSDDPSVWNTHSKGEKVAYPLSWAPAKLRYLRLRRMDTNDVLIIALTRDQLQNGKPPNPEAGVWWNGTAKDEWKGRHLGIVEAPRYKFPVPKDMIAVMSEGWDAFSGSGFCGKCQFNDRQYYCWQTREIPRTVFEVAVTADSLSDEETRWLLR